MSLDGAYIIKTVPLFGKALALTLEIGLGAAALSAIVGIGGSSILTLKIPVLSQLVKGFVHFSRNIPVIVFLFFLYFGLVQIGITLPGTACAIIGLAIMGSGFMIESFRAGFEAVDKIQYESAKSIGLNRLETLRYVALPQAFAIVLPSLLANVHAIFMETAVCGLIAVPELMSVTRDQIGMHYKTYECFLVLTAAYLVIILPLSLVTAHLERRSNHVQFN